MLDFEPGNPNFFLPASADEDRIQAKKSTSIRTLSDLAMIKTSILIDMCR